ncbi:hypothetical protein PGQ11_015160 [Apiospora arundinis]|uniref:Uncharacterized protein n=1 Tax=Apiospora arundinis TaxID=335852 RepID=A0ABR2HKL3_9PEZI
MASNESTDGLVRLGTDGLNAHGEVFVMVFAESRVAEELSLRFLGVNEHRLGEEVLVLAGDLGVAGLRWGA